MATVDWRVIPLETMTAAWAMALEEVLMERVAQGGPPTIRFWRWDPSAVTVGRFQEVEDEVVLHRCQMKGIDVVRRMSGGGTVFHDAHREFVFSLTAPEGMYPRDVVGAYTKVLGRIVAALGGLGLETRVKDDNNVMAGERKVSGNSQRRGKGALQVHGTVLWDVDEDTMFSVLRARPGRDAGSRATPSRHHPVAGVHALTGASYDQVYQAVSGALLEGRTYIVTSWTEGELTSARELVASKYGTDGWNLVL
jgi:lipoate-protein ligase A